MLEIAIMVEGQTADLAALADIAAAVEELGFAGLYRSDHFTNAEGRIKIHWSAGPR